MMAVVAVLAVLAVLDPHYDATYLCLWISNDVSTPPTFDSCQNINLTHFTNLGRRWSLWQLWNLCQLV